MITKKQSVLSGVFPIILEADMLTNTQGKLEKGSRVELLSALFHEWQHGKSQEFRTNGPNFTSQLKASVTFCKW